MIGKIGSSAAWPSSALVASGGSMAAAAERLAMAVRRGSVVLCMVLVLLSPGQNRPPGRHREGWRLSWWSCSSGICSSLPLAPCGGHLTSGRQARDDRAYPLQDFEGVSLI